MFLQNLTSELKKKDIGYYASKLVKLVKDQRVNFIQGYRILRKQITDTSQRSTREFYRRIYFLSLIKVIKCTKTKFFLKVLNFISVENSQSATLDIDRPKRLKIYRESKRVFTYTENES